jgi:hypothetical protein
MAIFRKDSAMRMRLFLLVVIAILLTTEQGASAQSRTGGRCIPHDWRFAVNSVTQVEGTTHEGQPCQMAFGLLGNDIEMVRITARPSHGMLGASEKEANRRYIAYAPRAGFVGHDRFEVFVRGTTPRGMTFTAQIKVEMNVTP